MPCCKENVASLRLLPGILFRSWNNQRCPNCRKELTLVNKPPRRLLLLFIAFFAYYTTNTLLIGWSFVRVQQRNPPLGSPWAIILMVCLPVVFGASIGIFPLLANDFALKRENMSEPSSNDRAALGGALLLGSIVGCLLWFILWTWPRFY
jgi:hypothetical protein